MATKQTILQCLTMIDSASDLNCGGKKLAEKTELFHQVCEELTDEEFQQATIKIIKSETDFYGKFPTVATFLKYAKGDSNPEQIAKLEVCRILRFVDVDQGSSPVIFDNPTTNACLANYGGHGTLYWELFDPYNRKHSSMEWVRRNLEQIWLACYSSNERRTEPVKGRCKTLPLQYEGDIEKCRSLIAENQELLEDEAAYSQERGNKVVKLADMAKKYRISTKDI